jgi:hypothetical protein
MKKYLSDNNYLPPENHSEFAIQKLYWSLDCCKLQNPSENEV